MNATHPAWLDRTLFPFESRFIDIGEHVIHYIDEGVGPTLLLLHGNPTWSFLYRHIVRRLSPYFRCIALDYPGFGLSTAAPGYHYTPREHSDVLESFVDILGLGDLRLMVQDWGGPIGLGMAGRRPELIHSLVVGNTFAWPARRSRGMTTFSRIVGSRLARRLIKSRNALVRWLIPAGINRTLTDAEMMAYTGPFPTPATRLPTWIFANQIRASEDYLSEVEAGLSRLADKPTLIVWGDADGAFRTPDRKRFTKLFPINRVMILKGAKHFIQENAPDEIASSMLDWQRALSTASGASAP
jgi:haloalkane dehalogenase